MKSPAALLLWYAIWKLLYRFDSAILLFFVGSFCLGILSFVCVCRRLYSAVQISKVSVGLLTISVSPLGLACLDYNNE